MRRPCKLLCCLVWSWTLRQQFISNSIRISQVCCTSHRCENRVSVKTISLKSIGLFCSKDALRILPYLLGCVLPYVPI